MRWTGCLQFVLGFFLGITLLGAGAAGVGYYFFTRSQEKPAKPIFAEEQPKEPEAAAKPEKAATEPAQEPAQVSEPTEPEETAPEEPEEPPVEPLPPGAYRARVTWPEGLAIRTEPTLDSGRGGGVPFNAELIILEDSSDGRWQRIKEPNSGQEGWVKAGNVEKLADAEATSEE